ncbi:MAG TPA: sulfotransferase [Spirochaetota bacterium]|nr:sulfotransferase [Spirochaetota bacterium]
MIKYLNPVNYITYFKNHFLKSISPLIKIPERKKIEKYAAGKLQCQPAFIIGAPRSGSTVLYQSLTNQLDLLYIDNLAAAFFRNLFWGCWLSDKIFKQKPHNCFYSEQGNTARCGMHAPSECGNFWYRWLPLDRHFINDSDFNKETAAAISKEIRAIINRWQKPFIFKNLNAGQRLQLIAAMFPDAKLIFIKRHPFFTAQSILQTRYRLKIKENAFWSVMPENINYLKTRPLYERIVKQIYYLEKQINTDMKLFKPANCLTVNYVDLGKNFNKIITRCRKLVKTTNKKNYKPAAVKINESVKIAPAEAEKINKEIAKLNWDTYND